MRRWRFIGSQIVRANVGGRLLAVAAAAGVIASVAVDPVRAGMSPGVVVVLDMPRGECRLLVRSDGSGLLTYGALPTWIRVRPGSLDAKGIAAHLRRVSAARSVNIPADREGSASFGRSGGTKWLKDEAWARRQFLNALNHAEPSEDPSQAAETLIRKACAEAP